MKDMGRVGVEVEGMHLILAGLVQCACLNVKAQPLEHRMLNRVFLLGVWLGADPRSVWWRGLLSRTKLQQEGKLD